MRYVEAVRLRPVALGKEGGPLLAAESIAASARVACALLASAPDAERGTCRVALRGWVTAFGRFTGLLLIATARGQRVAMRILSVYLLRCLRLSFTMRAPTVAAAPPSSPFVIVSLCSVPNFLADVIIGSAAAWNPSSKAPEPVAAS